MVENSQLACVAILIFLPMTVHAILAYKAKQQGKEAKSRFFGASSVVWIAIILLGFPFFSNHFLGTNQKALSHSELMISFSICLTWVLMFSFGWAAEANKIKLGYALFVCWICMIAFTFMLLP